MKELDLYRFIQDNSVEVAWRGDALIAWVSHHDIKEFAALLGTSIFDDGGLECRLHQDGSIGIDLSEICDRFDIEPKRICADKQ